MRYFAMIDGERRGPFELHQLTEVGVKPDTYVWCKEMKDWDKAENVADICRYFRNHIFDMMHSPNHNISQSQPEPQRGITRFGGSEINVAESMPDTSKAPAPTLFISIMLTLFCFPITGMVAVYFSYKARVAWQESLRSESDNSKNLYSDKERENLRILAHNYGRQAKMWIGITFFLSIILYAFVGHNVF